MTSNLRVIHFVVTVCFIGFASSICLNDKHRPQFHFSPAKYWINDPNGLIYVDGEYHMFYQYYPNGTIHGTMYWGHAISTDLLYWEELPIALSPDGLGEIFSGSAVLDVRNTSGLQTGTNLPIILIYTQEDGAAERQSIAVSNDKGRTFQKYSGNPVLTDPSYRDFRDPKVYEINGKWVMSLAVKDSIDFYSSSDLIHWTALSKFGGDPIEGAHGGVWECPDLLSFDLDGNTFWVLLVSINPGGPNLGSVTQYFLGDFDGKVFRKYGINQNLWMDWGPDNYAGVTFANDPLNRKVLIAWMSNWLYGEKVPTEAWRGQMTIPRVLELKRVDKTRVRLASSPSEELKKLRSPSDFYEKTAPLIIQSGNVYDFTADLAFVNPLLEVDALIDTNLVTADSSASFQLCFYNRLNEQLCVGYSYGQNSIYLDRSNSGSVSFDTNFGQRATAQRETKNKIIQLKLFLDTSAIEVFADEGVTAMTGLFYPTEPLSSIRIGFTSANSANQLSVLSITVQGLKSIYSC
ncbi:levanase-like [Bradysia coprophila]|uniref:levanase-like n=1 Tax=Bradysia coprophila TaxID=38358 RepID=UPI00187DC415|nr:levanase-like [Bradysia coprophila]